MYSRHTLATSLNTTHESIASANHLSITHDEDPCLDCSATAAWEGLVKLEFPIFCCNCQQPQALVVPPGPDSQGAER